MLAGSECLAVGNAVLQAPQRPLVLLLIPARLPQLLSEGLAPPLQLLHTGLQDGPLRTLLQQQLLQSGRVIGKNNGGGGMEGTVKEDRE